MKIYTDRNVFKVKSINDVKHRKVAETGKSGDTLKWKQDNGESMDHHKIFSQAGLKSSVKYYLQNTTLHGLKYLAEDKLTISERIFFGLSFVFVVILSGFFISNIYVKWSISPIIISTSARQTLTTSIPFPAITICNLNQALKSKVKAINRASANYSLLMSLCDLGDPNVTYVGTWAVFKQILLNVAQPCNEMLLFCSFGSRTEECSAIFNSVLTDDGLCCTFNALDPSFLLRNYSEDNRLSYNPESHHEPIDWTPENGYAADLPPHFYPRTSGGTGSGMGLTVILNSSSDQYFCTKSKSVGFKVLIHNPAELPKISNYGFLVTAGRETRVPVEPIYQNAVPSIRSIHKQVRRCLFSDEGDLMFYRIYSRKNCELECEANILIRKCKCVLYYLPRIDPNIRICGPNDNMCTNQVQSEIESSDPNVSCATCLPGCFELSYKATVTASNIVHGDFYSADNYPVDVFDPTIVKDVSILHIYYLSDIFRGTTKSEIIGFTEFLSNTGGLLGLFMGFSIFSLIEIVYYITVRPYCANRMAEKAKRRRLKAELKHVTAFKYKVYKNNLNLPFFSTYTMNKSLAKKKYKTCQRQILNRSEKLAYEDTHVFPYIN